MMKFTCANCGEVRRENVLPGKHAIMGTIRSLEKQKDCCETPEYQSSKATSHVQKDLREMALSRA